MKSLTPSLVALVRTAFKGARLAKFDASVAVINESLALGGWISRGSVKASGGFYQGICKASVNRRNELGGGPEYGSKEYRAYNYADGVSSVLSYGSAFNVIGSDEDEEGRVGYIVGQDDQWITGVKLLREKGGLKLSDEIVNAWRALCVEKAAAIKLLDNARPLPKITPIGLSPKVTKTLKECNLDLDLPSIRMADIEERFRPAFEWTYKEVPATPTRFNRFKKVEKIRDKLVPAFNKDGTRKMEPYYVVVWTKGITHRMSRFAGSGCHACGKHIPSGKFVPIEAQDKKSGKLISMWLGCDCSANIFGIKDVGIEQGVKS